MSPAQEKAVRFGGGPLMVLAGPGSGKTLVITERVRFLVSEAHIDPSKILVVTFSRAAAGEMRERFLKLSVEGGRRVTFGTFHSLFFGILRTAYGYAADQVASGDERMSIVLGLIREQHLETEDVKGLALNLLSEIALVKEERAEIRNYYANCCPADPFREIFRRYEEALGSLKKIDYEDMLLMTYELLAGRPDILAALRERYQWILVDEFQDINRLQYEIVRMLAGDRKNLTIVGDDDQSIYRFRGARPEIMLGFEKDLPDAKRVLLDLNFRSTPEIVETAGRLIEKNRSRFKKKIKAVREHGPAVNTVVCPDPGAEAAYVTRRIRELTEGGMKPGEIAVLYRTNLQPRLLGTVLLSENVPFKMSELLPDLMEHWIAKDFSAYLRLSRNIGDRGDLLRIVNRPNRFIKREYAADAGSSVTALKRFYPDKAWMRERIDRLNADLKSISRMPVDMAIAYIRKEVGYDGFLKEYAEQHRLEESELLSLADEIMDSAEGCRFPEDWFEKTEELKQALLKKHERSRDAGYGRDGEEENDGVRLMTFHASKGLEFKVVFIIEANDGITPHRKAGTPEELEEERRMFYVAMTRAKDVLEICTCRKRFRRSADESPFIKEYEG